MSTKRFARTAGLAAGFVALLVFAAATLRGPHGYAAARKLYHDIRQLQGEVDTLRQEVQERKERNQRLRTSPAEQEMEIRRRLKLLRKGEKTFILPESPKSTETVK